MLQILKIMVAVKRMEFTDSRGRCTLWSCSKDPSDGVAVVVAYVGKRSARIPRSQLTPEQVALLKGLHASGIKAVVAPECEERFRSSFLEEVR